MGLALLGLWLEHPAWALDPGRAIGQYVHDRWTQKDGLPEGSVLSIQQSSDGYLWLGLQAGLARFDGLRVTPFQEGVNGLKQHSFGRDLFEDPDGAMFAGLAGGVARFAAGHFTFYDEAQGLEHPFVYGLAAAPGGALWVGTGGSGVWQLRQGSFLHHPAYDANPRLPGKVNDLAVDAHGKLWVATEDGVLAIDGAVRRYTTEDGLPSLIANVLWIDRRGVVWVGTRSGLARAPSGDARVFTADPTFAHHDVSALLEDRTETFWVGTRDGDLTRLRDGRIERTRGRSEEGSILALAEDRDGSLWVGTSQALERYRTGAFVTSGREQGFADEQILNITPRRAGGLWVLDGRGAISIFDAGRVSEVAPPDTIAGEGMLGFVETDDGSLWIGGKVLNRLKNGRWSHVSNSGGEFTVLVSDGHDLIVAQTTGDGTSTLSRLAGDIFTPIATDVKLTHVQRIRRDRAGRLWITTGGGGIVRLDPDGGHRAFRVADGLPHDITYGIEEDPDGNIWVATRSGLARIKGDRVTGLADVPGLPRHAPMHVQTDGLGGLWITAIEGIFRASLAELNAIADGARRTPRVDRFTMADGLRSVHLSWRSSAQTRGPDGRLWYATTRGLSEVDPRTLALPQGPPPVLIEELLANGRAFDTSGPVSLKEGRERIEIRFTAPSPTGAEQLRFRYRLAGYEGDWTEAGAVRSATYTNMPAGTYTFRVAAKRAGGIYGNNEAALEVRIAPRWHETLLARASALAALALLLWGLYRLQLRRLKQRDRMLVQKVAERTHALDVEVAERRTAEHEVRRLNEQLEERVRERTVQLETANRALADDILERKRAEAALADEKERLAVTLRSIADGVITTDLEARVVLMNPVAERHTGWTTGDGAGRHLDEVFHVLDRDTRDARKSPVSDVLTAPATKATLLTRAILVGRTGGEILFDASAAPIHDSASHVVGAVLVFRDITAKTKGEEQLQKTQKLEAVGILAAGIAHDFNNLLTGIFGHVDLALTTLPAESQASTWLRDAAEVIDSARGLARQLLTFSSGGRPATEPHSISQLVTRSTRFVLSGSNVSAELTIPDDLWPCEIDPAQIRQAIDNLVLNAREAMTTGGHVKIRGANVQLRADEVPGLVAGRYVELVVSDDGPGIPPAIRERIFEPFFTTKVAGSGLGLTTVHSIITQHGGSIDLEPPRASGTAFHIRLPAAAPSTSDAAPERPHADEPASARVGRILVMDDEPMIRKLIGAALKKLGYEVSVAADGSEAVAMFNAASAAGQAFEVVILDLTIAGGMGGPETLAALRALDPKVRAIASSGYSTGALMADPQAHGFVGTLAKPYTMVELADAIAAARQ